MKALQCSENLVSADVQEALQLFYDVPNRAGGIRTRTRVTPERILSHQHLANPYTTICSTSMPGMPISSRSVPIAGPAISQVRSTFEIDVLVD